MLDVPSITFLSNYLGTYPNTVLVVSHDRAFLNEVATDIIYQHSERLDYYKGANFGGSLPRMVASADGHY
jgi:ATP-binding cassette, subfamily F, member 3